MPEPTNTEIKALLTNIANTLPTLATKADVADLGKRMDRLEVRLDKLDVGQVDIKERLIRVDARLDEQRQTVNALIPTKLAAIPDKQRA